MINQELDTAAWHLFATQENLTEPTVEAFKKYAALLEEWHERINITAIEGTKNIIRHHFQDSLRVADSIDFSTIKSIADVGSGGGFPGLPLKLKYPHLQVVLIEVSNKKIQFLETVIRELGLENVEVSPLDWRTFLRKTDYQIDLFLARASLHTDELVRLFKPGCRYHKARLVYWAAETWQPGPREEPYVKKSYEYTIGSRKRRCILFYNESSGTF